MDRRSSARATTGSSSYFVLVFSYSKRCSRAGHRVREDEDEEEYDKSVQRSVDTQATSPWTIDGDHTTMSPEE